MGAVHFGVLFTVYCLVSISSDVSAMSEEQKAKVHEMFQHVGQQCVVEHPLTEDEIAKMKTKQAISEGTHCFVACMMKKTGLVLPRLDLSKHLPAFGAVLTRARALLARLPPSPGRERETTPPTCPLAHSPATTRKIDEMGMLQKESVLESAKAIFDDESEIKALGDYLHTCSSVNAEAVGDGAKGCERAGKAYKCMIENASQFGFDL